MKKPEQTDKSFRLTGESDHHSHKEVSEKSDRDQV